MEKDTESHLLRITYSRTFISGPLAISGRMPEAIILPSNICDVSRFSGDSKWESTRLNTRSSVAYLPQTCDTREDLDLGYPEAVPVVVRHHGKVYPAEIR